ncbi:MAG: hydroxymethylglutaryl-CoA reductase [Saprospiraceae bacterium]
MKGSKIISGFSKMTKMGKLKWLAENFFTDPALVIEELKGYWHDSDAQQKILDGFSENTISNFPMPYGVAPNFLIDNKTFAVPMVIEESSVVAASASAAKFWLNRGGFKTEILGTKKVGQLHFKFSGGSALIKQIFPALRNDLIAGTTDLTASMNARGGGISTIRLIDFSDKEPDYYQIRTEFETCDSMGANFINSILEQFGIILEKSIIAHDSVLPKDKDVQIIMAILSNYTPDCVVRASVSCKISELGDFTGGMSAEEFADKFNTAIKIAHIDPYRATTHNKGIFNGVDAIVLATGNDFRAIEASGHAYAARDGQYRSLSYCTLENKVFNFWTDLPMAIGTVGGLTTLHPMAKTSLQMLGNPNAQQLMRIIASVGLAQNFAALRSLVTTGIQKGHMKMHLQNILNHMEATDIQIKNAAHFFRDKTVSFSAVRAFLKEG